MYPPDEELIARAKRRDKQAFTELFDRYRDKIFGYLCRYVRDHHKAEDLTVETFLFAYKRLHTYTEMGRFSSWLYKIATNCAKKEIERHFKRGEISIDESVDAVEDISLGDMIADEKARPDYRARENELKEYVYSGIARLDMKYRKTLLLCDVEGLSYEEVAKVLKTNPITVGTWLRRARTMLHDILKKSGYEF